MSPFAPSTHVCDQGTVVWKPGFLGCKSELGPAAFLFICTFHQETFAHHCGRNFYITHSPYLIFGRLVFFGKARHSKEPAAFASRPFFFFPPPPPNSVFSESSFLWHFSPDISPLASHTARVRNLSPPPQTLGRLGAPRGGGVPHVLSLRVFNTFGPFFPPQCFGHLIETTLPFPGVFAGKGLERGQLHLCTREPLRRTFGHFFVVNPNRKHFSFACSPRSVRLNGHSFFWSGFLLSVTETFSSRSKYEDTPLSLQPSNK